MNIGDDMKQTMDVDAFINAAKRNDKNLIEQYLDHGFNIDEPDQYGFTALLESAEFGHAELFWYLVERKADITIKTRENFTLAHALALGGDPSMLDFIETKGVSLYEKVNSGEQSGMGMKEYAVMANNLAILDALSKRGIHV